MKTRAMQLLPAALLSVAILMLAACGRTERAPAALPDHPAGSQIAWHKGDVGSAFALAAAEKKPVLLYWGAVWCPPCHQLKTSVFSRPDFIAKSQLFVPVYLDGDDPGAQKWGDEFNVTGYPTLVVLNAQRQELMRISGGMDLSQYANVLDNALADLQPVSALLTAAATRRLSASECQRLAFNAWSLDYLAAGAASAARQRELVHAAAQCPAEAGNDRARILMVAAYYAEQSGEPLPAALLQAVDAVLADPARAADNFDVLTGIGDGFFKAVGKPGSPTALAFNARFAAAMDAAAAHPRYTTADRLYAVARKLAAAKALTGKIEPVLATAARARLDAALAESSIPYVRSGIINSALPLYDLLGANADAYVLLQGELAKTETPYYYQADLAVLAERLGKHDEALAWYAKAYEGSRGAATRFQWGRGYLAMLLRLKSDDTALIRDTGLRVLGELEGDDRIYRRARTRLAQLDDELRAWAAGNRAQRQPVLRALKDHMGTTCGKIPANEPARASCSAFLATGL